MINIALPLNKPELYNYTPHQSRMLLIDSVVDLSIEDSTLHSSLIITKDSEFLNLNKNIMPIWVSFEYMAQSIATLSGICSRLENREPKIGFIVGVRDFNSYCTGFKIGDKVDIYVKKIFKEANVAVFECESYVDSQLKSSASLNVVESSTDILDQWKSNF